MKELDVLKDALVDIEEGDYGIAAGKIQAVIQVLEDKREKFRKAGRTVTEARRVANKENWKGATKTIREKSKAKGLAGLL